jgi:hypothetical protein
MKKTLLPAIMVFIILALIGCGHDHNNAQPTIIAHILSDPVFDGDILENPPGVFTITQGMTLTPPAVQSVFAGVDPLTFAEYRAFLDFPLTGANGVPSNAVIVSATLDIVINSIQPPAGTIPIRIELVSIPGLTLVAPDDFSRTLLPAITFTTIVPPISSFDVGNHVAVDVTSLMVKAQNLGLLDFQVRILEDLGFVPAGTIEINDNTIDQTVRGDLAPLLKVEYF